MGTRFFLEEKEGRKDEPPERERDTNLAVTWTRKGTRDGLGGFGKGGRRVFALFSRCLQRPWRKTHGKDRRPLRERERSMND